LRGTPSRLPARIPVDRISIPELVNVAGVIGSSPPIEIDRDEDGLVGNSIRLIRGRRMHIVAPCCARKAMPANHRSSITIPSNELETRLFLGRLRPAERSSTWVALEGPNPDQAWVEVVPRGLAPYTRRLQISFEIRRGTMC